MRQMIYHVPYPIQESSQAASAIRPRKMRDAFAAIGYRVFEVSGNAAERRMRIRAIKARLERGERFDFCYSESSTIATPLTEPRHLPPHPFLDLAFLTHLHRKGVPVGLFYRDIYWRYPDYVESVGRALAVPLRALYLWDLAWYRVGLDRLFLPSLKMGEVVPIVPRDRGRALPPGCDVVDLPEPGEGLRIFYVGGIGAHYRLDTLLGAVSGLEGVELTVCTRREAWEGEKERLAPLMADNIRVVHASGDELEQFYAWASITSLVVEPSGYRGFAAPLKLFEYLGHARPILASAGTLAGQIVAESGAGWTVDYDVDSVRRQLTYLRDHPDEVAAKAAQARVARLDHTWEARARQVADELSPLARPSL